MSPLHQRVSCPKPGTQEILTGNCLHPLWSTNAQWRLPQIGSGSVVKTHIRVSFLNNYSNSNSKASSNSSKINNHRSIREVHLSLDGPVKILPQLITETRDPHWQPLIQQLSQILSNSWSKLCRTKSCREDWRMSHTLTSHSNRPFWNRIYLGSRQSLSRILNHRHPQLLRPILCKALGPRMVERIITQSRSSNFWWLKSTSMPKWAGQQAWLWSQNWLNKIRQSIKLIR